MRAPPEEARPAAPTADLAPRPRAVAGFVGYCIQANGICFPWKLTGETSFADIAAAGGPADQWDALPSASKLQILG